MRMVQIGYKNDSSLTMLMMIHMMIDVDHHMIAVAVVVVVVGFEVDDYDDSDIHEYQNDKQYNSYRSMDYDE